MTLLLAVLGLSVGYFLAGVVKARVMLVGSAVFWVAALFTWFYVGLSSENLVLFWSMLLVLCADFAYVIEYFVWKRRT